MPQRSVLVTGGSGYLGRAVLAELSDDDVEVYALVHRHRLTPRNGVRTVIGDITKPDLGLTAEVVGRLRSRPATVIHCAAVTDFSVQRSDIVTVNVDGTQQVASLAQRVGARLVYVSSAFARSDVAPPTSDLDPGGYLRSKHDGEDIVRASGCEWAIVRPSLLGPGPGYPHVADTQGLALFLRSLLTDRSPVVPRDSSDRVDFVATNLVAEAVAMLACTARSDAFGVAWWLTAGDQAWRIDELVAAVAEFRRGLGEPGPFPRVMPPEVMNRLFVPVFLPMLPAGIQARIRNLQRMAPVLFRIEPFPSSWQELGEVLGRRWWLNSSEVFAAAVALIRGAATVRVPM